MSPIEQTSAASFVAGISAAFAQGDAHHQAKSIETSNVETVRAAFDHLLSGKIDVFAACLADDAVLEVSGFPPWNGRWEGRDAFLAGMARNFGGLAEQNPSLEGLVAQGDQVVLQLNEQGKFASGESYHLRAGQWFTLRGGKIASLLEIVGRVGSD